MILLRRIRNKERTLAFIFRAFNEMSILTLLLIKFCNVILFKHVHERVAYKLLYWFFSFISKKKRWKLMIRLMRVYLKGTFPDDDTRYLMVLILEWSHKV